MYARGLYSGFIRYYAAPMPFRGGCRLAGKPAGTEPEMNTVTNVNKRRRR